MENFIFCAVEGPTNEITFFPMFVLRKGILSFSNLVFYLLYNVEQIQNFFQIIRASVIDKFECNSFYTLTLSLVGSQFIDLKSSSHL